jgi:hypothetical protein
MESFSEIYISSPSPTKKIFLQGFFHILYIYFIFNPIEILGNHVAYTRSFLQHKTMIESFWKTKVEYLHY